MKFNLQGGKTPTDSFATVQDHVAHHVQLTFDQVEHAVAYLIQKIEP